MVKKITRRMRCEVTGCKEQAYVGLGPKGVDYVMCKAHFEELIKEGMEMLEIGMPKVVLEPEAPKAEPAEEKAEAEEEYYVCKYCGEKFSKKEMTPQQFMSHSKKCKKEHEAK